jgi:hypothetical protein
MLLSSKTHAETRERMIPAQPSTRFARSKLVSVEATSAPRDSSLWKLNNRRNVASSNNLQSQVSFGPFSDSNSPSTQSMDNGDWGYVLNLGFAMSIGYPPHNKQRRLGVLLGAENVVPPREKDALPRGDEPPHQETNDVQELIQKNALLRKLAVRLSNLLGDLPPAIPTASDDE